jgi:hypothetical protein
VLGVPAIFISTTGRGYTDEQETRFKLVRNFKPEQQEDCLKTAIEIAGIDLADNRAVYQGRRAELLETSKDTTKWMVDFVEKHISSH